MVDQLLMRHSALHHDKFTADMSRAVGKVIRSAKDAFKRKFGISKAYARDKWPAASISQSILAGFTASLMTLALFAGTWAVSIPTYVSA